MYSEMSDFIAEKLDTLFSNEDYTSIAYLDGTNSLAFRLTPTGSPNDYMKGDTFKFNFQVMIRCEKKRDTIKLADKALKLLHNQQNMLNLTSPFKIITIKCTNLPSLINRDEKNRDIYSMMFESEIESI